MSIIVVKLKQNIIFQIVLEELRSHGNLEWADPKSKRRCHIYWRSPEEWGTLIYGWANENRFQFKTH